MNDISPTLNLNSLPFLPNLTPGGTSPGIKKCAEVGMHCAGSSTGSVQVSMQCAEARHVRVFSDMTFFLGAI